MIILFIIICIVLLLIIEFAYQISPSSKKVELFTTIKNSESYKTLKLYECLDDSLQLNTFTGKIYFENVYGFFIHLNTWYILKMNTLYDFHSPVTIKIINYDNKKIQYYIEA